MWLLNTETFKLVFFNGPQDEKLSQDGSYAILSHTWEEKEQTFQDIQALYRTPTSPSERNFARARVSLKIRNCCTLAVSHGYRWVWIDTCCIDKTSSAELSEAINSMYAWYAQAAICYAYLYDVDEEDFHPDSQFYKSRWFSRGWTLQELIAPTSLIFMSKNWNLLGSRTDLVEHIAKITRIDADVLLGRREPRTVSIAQRMSWASSRRTTRVEDEAYCLLGIFGVNMPTIYGEGCTAFRRLQEEIMKISPDQTIFAWGRCLDSNFISSAAHLHNTELPSVVDHRKSWCLLASSPRDFHLDVGGSIQPEPIPVADAVRTVVESDWLNADIKTASSSKKEAMNGTPRASEFTITPHGMRSTLPVFWTGGRDICVVVLGCRDAHTGSVIGLLLGFYRDTDPESYRGDHDVYATCVGFSGRPKRLPSETEQHRLAVLGVPGRRNAGGSKTGTAHEKLAFVERRNRPYREISWETLYIMHNPPLGTGQVTDSMDVIHQRDFFINIQLSRWSIVDLRTWSFLHHNKHDVTLATWMPMKSRYQIHEFVSDIGHGQSEKFTVIIGDCFCNHHLNSWFYPPQTFIILFGMSHPASTLRSSIPNVPALKAVLEANDCSLGHMRSGQNWTKHFGNEERAIQLTGRTLKPVNTEAASDWRTWPILIDIKISGSVYTSLRSRTPHRPHSGLDLEQRVARLNVYVVYIKDDFTQSETNCRHHVYSSPAAKEPVATPGGALHIFQIRSGHTGPIESTS